MAKRFIFTYLFCDDLAAMKTFYGRVLGLDQIWEDEGSIAFRIGDHQLSVTLDDQVEPGPAKFSRQPGWEGGTEPRTCWSLECDSEDFRSIVRASKAAAVRSFVVDPVWRGYWSYPLLDPMNNTVEVTCSEESALI